MVRQTGGLLSSIEGETGYETGTLVHTMIPHSKPDYKFSTELKFVQAKLPSVTSPKFVIKYNFTTDKLFIAG